MALARRLWQERIAPPLMALAEHVGRFFEECAFRLSLAYAVLAGHLPMVRPRRWWNRSTEPPTLINTFDWTQERLVFSVLVWPGLEEPAHNSHRDHRERTRQVLEVLHAGASGMSWCTRYEVDRSLRWDAARECWVSTDGHAYDGERLREYSRGGAV